MSDKPSRPFGPEPQDFVNLPGFPDGRPPKSAVSAGVAQEREAERELFEQWSATANVGLPGTIEWTAAWKGWLARSGLAPQVAPPAQPEPLSDERITELGHRHAWRYKHSTDPHHSHTYTFNGCCLHDFARAIEKAITVRIPADKGEGDKSGDVHLTARAGDTGSPDKPVELPPLPASWRGASAQVQAYARAAVLADRAARAADVSDRGLA